MLLSGLLHLSIFSVVAAATVVVVVVLFVVLSCEAWLPLERLISLSER